MSLELLANLIGQHRDLLHEAPRAATRARVIGTCAAPASAQAPRRGAQAGIHGGWVGPPAVTHRLQPRLQPARC